MKEINLEAILYNTVAENPHGDRVYFKEDVIQAMKQVCLETLELASEGAECSIEYYAGDYGEPSAVLNRDSILNLKGRIK